MQNGSCLGSSTCRCATSGFVHIESAWRAQPKAACSTSELVWTFNLPFYARNAREIFGLDPSPRLLRWAQANAQKFHSPVHLIEGSAEGIPLADCSLDTIVMTWTGCSIPEVRLALEEMRRLLKIGGRLLFVEHGRAPEKSVACWQDRLDPFWHRLSGGCHLNRKIDDLLSHAGFRINRLETGYIPGPRLMTFFYEGAATPS